MQVSDLQMLVERTDEAERAQAPAPAHLFITEDVRLTLDAMMRLKNSTTFHEYVNNITELHNLSDRDEALICMEDYNPHRYVLECLSRFPGEETIERVAFDYLLKLSCLSGKLRSKIQTSRFLMESVLVTCERCFRISLEDVDMQMFGIAMELLSSVLIQGNYVCHVAQNVNLCNHIKETLLKSVQPRFLVCCARILTVLDVAEFALEDYIRSNLTSFIALFKAHATNGHVVTALSHFFTHIIRQSDFITTDLVRLNLHGSLVSSLERLTPAIQIQALLTCLGALLPNERIETDLNTPAFHRTLVNTALKFQENAGVQTAVLHIFVHMGHLLLTQSSCDEEAYWLKIIGRNIRSFMFIDALIIAYCKALRCLLEHKEGTAEKICDFIETSHVPIHIQIMGVLFQSASLFGNPTNVLCAALDCLYWLTIENSYLQKTIF